MANQPDVTFVEHFVAMPDELLHAVLTETVWDERLHARRTASYGAPYNYSQMTYPEAPLPAYLLSVRDALARRLGFTPNNCLMNYYVAGTSSMGFHADSLAELVPQTGVAIVSLGDTRTLTFRQTEHKDVRWGCPLPHGSLLYMPPDVQRNWQHGILRQEGAGQRVSLTFRALV